MRVIKIFQNLLLFAFIYAVYHLSLFPSVPGGDSGELLSESCVLGIAHPPGYPLFILLNNIIKRVNVPRFLLSNGAITIDMAGKSTVAWKINNFCAILGAFSALIIGKCSQHIFHAINRLNGITCTDSQDFPPILLTSVIYAFSPLVWEYSITAEVFALNNFICSILLYLALLVSDKMTWVNKSSSTSSLPLFLVYVGAFICGIAFSNQHASFLSVFPLILYVIYAVFVNNKANFLKTVIYSSFSFLLGLCPYSYLYWSSKIKFSPGSWGDTSTLMGLIRHILRSEYGTFKLGIIEGSEGFLERVWLYLIHSSNQTGHIILPMVASCVFFYFETVYRQKRKTTGSINSNTSKSIKTNKTPQKSKRIEALKSSVTVVEVTNEPIVKAEPVLSSGIMMVFCSWAFYVIIWHGILSNLPLSSPMPYGVHARFWMQPDIFLHVLSGAGIHALFNVISSRVLKTTTEGIRNVLFGSLSIAYISYILYHRFPTSDKSSSGWVMHKYAESALRSLPQNSLLLSHTDLDWNPIRYLRTCEGMRPDVTHLSFQMMPFPWFETRQKHLFPQVKFPNLQFSGVSTTRGSKGNGELVHRVLLANDAHRIKIDGTVNNKKGIEGGIFVDMQAISEVEIEYCGYWRGLTLLPWGSQYRVYGNLSTSEVQLLHSASYIQLKQFQSHFPHVDDSFVSSFPAGSWEFAAASVFYDAHYQFGLNLLTFTMSSKPSTPSDLLIVLDRSYIAAEVLEMTQRAVNKYKTISSAELDVHKNTALSWMKLYSFLAVSIKFEETINDLSTEHLLNPNVKEILNGRGLDNIKAKAQTIIRAFVNDYPKDKDVLVFEKFLREK